MNAFTRPVTPEDVAELIDLTVVGQEETESMARLQRQGIAALYDILCRGEVAYLADEVGMGKTYQALGLAAVVWNDQPNARILFVSPRENLQLKWLDDYHRFFADNYRRRQGTGDDVVSSVLFRRPVHRGVKHDNLRTWTRSLGRREPTAAFLRHTSFTRPVHIRPAEHTTPTSFWGAVTELCRAAGLHDVEAPTGLSLEDGSRQANFAFAAAANQRLHSLSPDEAHFDLVVVDEAQCLRHPENQTNTILHRMLDGHVRKWLFMSATPAHGGPGDIPRVVNHYPSSGEVIDPALVDDLPALQDALEPLMVRRQRHYATADPAGALAGKQDYRDHDAETWKVTGTQMSALATLGIGLVQKGLVDVLEERGNRFRIGFLSSFESLHASVKAGTVEEVEDEDQGDWHRDVGDSSTEDEAPDTALVGRLVADFADRFDRPMPHPKVDAAVDRIGPAAFGTDTDPGGQKLLVFTRRVSTVETLRARLTDYHRRRVETRLARVWGHHHIDWHQPPSVEDLAVDDVDDPESLAEDQPTGDLIREAMQEGNWLERYRRTFSYSGRNALFFEDGWIRRLCEAGGVDLHDAADRIDDRLWAESWAHASQGTGSGRRQHRAERLRYLAFHVLDRQPEALGLDAATRRLCLDAYERILHRHVDPEPEPDPDPHIDLGLVTHVGLWSEWERAGLTPLPASDPTTATTDDLLERQVARSVLSQILHLTDTLVDLWAADEAGGRDPSQLADQFVEWAASDDLCAIRLHRSVEQWISHLRLIADSSLDGAGEDWGALARRESWPQLFQLSPVLGVVGGSGAQQRATRQFRTPTFPGVIVCTDTLKEGVDLHLFCDRVLHYGVAWTAGDLEQRVGRVDRYFSQIERRLRDSAPGEVRLEIGYPHVEPSIERRQVLRVLDRQRHAETLMDSPLADGEIGGKEMSAADAPAPRRTTALQPFTPHIVEAPARTIAEVSAHEAGRIADHYARWHRSLAGAFADAGLTMTPRSDVPEAAHELSGDGHNHELEWTYDAATGRYIVTVTDPLRDLGAGFTGGTRRRLRERRYVEESFIQALVPATGDPTDPELPRRLA